MALGNYKRYMVIKGTPCCNHNNKFIGLVFEGVIKTPTHVDTIHCVGCKRIYSVLDYSFAVALNYAVYLKSTVIELPGDVTDEHEEVSKELELQN